MSENRESRSVTGRFVVFQDSGGGMGVGDKEQGDFERFWNGM